MQKDTWTIIGVMVTLVGLLATFMVTGLASIESRLTAMDGRLHEMNTRLSRIEGYLGLPADVEPIHFETMDEVIIFKEDGRSFNATGLRREWRPRRGRAAIERHLDAPGIPVSPCPSCRAGTSLWPRPWPGAV